MGGLNSDLRILTWMFLRAAFTGLPVGVFHLAQDSACDFGSGFQGGPQLIRLV